MSWNIEGKVVLITGATGGIGLDAAIALARQGARPIIVGRGRTVREQRWLTSRTVPVSRLSERMTGQRERSS